MSTLLGVRRRAAACGAALCILLAGSTPVRATLQEGKAEPARSPSELEAPPYSVPSPAAVPTGAVSSIDLVRRAMSANAGLAAARLDVDRARARLRQAGLRPNPSLDLERRTGRFTGSSGEGEASVGVAVPLELFGQRARRVDLAEVELDAAEAEIAERERQLASEVRGRFAEALAASRDLRVTSELNRIAESTAKVVETRVAEGESAPLELQLLNVELDRMRSRRALVEAQLEATLLELGSLVGLEPPVSVALGEDLATVAWVEAPPSLGEAVDVALRSRPDLKLARLEERVAEAGLRLARARSAPEVTAFTRFSVERSVFDDTPVGALRDRDRSLAFGVSIGLPVFDRNQGGREEAGAGVAQARKRREYAEQRVRAEVAAAYARVKAAEAAVGTFERGVIARSNQALRSVRGAYQIGAYRMTELLAEQRRFVDAQREYTETLRERYRALSDLQSAMGLIAPFSERAPGARPDVAASPDGTYPGLPAGSASAASDEEEGVVKPVRGSFARTTAPIAGEEPRP